MAFANVGRMDSLHLEAALVAAGPLAKAYERLWASIWAQPYVSAAVLELCRLRVARLRGADCELQARHPSAQAPDFSEDKAQAVIAGQITAARGFTPAERAALEFAELHAIDANMITDELADEVKKHFGEKGLVALIEALGVIDGRIRVGQILTQLQSGSAS